MCGICGELHFDGRVPDLTTIGKMMSVLARRGPDHDGSYSDGPIALGHRRLAIIDLSPRSDQPLVDKDLGLALVFNGTIYNYRELRAELMQLGYQFFSKGDSEVILKAYAAWGEDCVRHLNGMFAFAIWDMVRQELFLARDRFGVKPLYYSVNSRCLRFASTSQALLAAGGVNTDIDPVALQFHFTLHAVVPAPRTVLRGVRKLEPACTLTIDKVGRRKLHRYWALRAQRPDRPLSEWEWAEVLHDALREAVHRRLQIADVTVGVLLSGGLDSSLLVALLHEAGVTDLRTFSVGFEDQPEERGSEFEYSDLIAAQFGTRHRKINIPNDEVLTRLPEAVDNMAEPMVGQDAVAFFLLAERVSREVKVVQCGQGADEVFGGYFWYPRMDAELGADIDRFRMHYFDRDHDEFLEMVGSGYRGPDYVHAALAARLAQPGADTFIDKVLRLDVTTLIVDDPVKRVDNMTMAWGLEARVPFLDQKLVELAAQMPPEFKLKGEGKHPLRLIARGLVPDAVIDRPKGYFPVPALKFVRGRFLDFMRDILDSAQCRQRGLYQREYVEQLLADPEGRLTRIMGSKLWHLTLLELWLQRNT
jgi:asparagine synthase (glutamine-hydrolysing)